MMNNKIFIEEIESCFYLDTDWSIKMRRDKLKEIIKKYAGNIDSEKLKDIIRQIECCFSLDQFWTLVYDKVRLMEAVSDIKQNY